MTDAPTSAPLFDAPAPPESWRSRIKIHPAADLFPMMSPEKLEALANDIDEHAGARMRYRRARSGRGCMMALGVSLDDLRPVAPDRTA